MSDSAPPKSLPARQVAAAVFGNALEFYDFTIYIYFAVQIGRTFFPSHSEFASLMLSLGTAGVGFLGRPIGAIVLGTYGDRKGRKPAMLLCFALMGTAIVGLTFTPSYATIGMAAPVIVVILRLVQGFALGGDVGPTTAFLLEAAPPEHRGLYGALQFSSQGLSTLLGGIVGVTLASILDTAALQSYGWRIAFLLGAFVLPVGYIVRRTLPETLHHSDPAEDAIAPHRERTRTVMLGLLMLASMTVGFYTLAYLATYAQTVLAMKANVAFAATIIFGACNLVFSAIGGALSDRFGRKPMMVGARVLFALAILPAFAMIVRNRDAATLLLATFVLASLSQLGSAGIVALTEALPRRIRSTALSIVYATSISVFGGSTQPMIAWLIHATGDALAPAYYLMAATLIGIVAMALMRETAPVILARKSGRG